MTGAINETEKIDERTQNHFVESWRNLASLISTSPSEVNEGISISERCERSNYGHRQKHMYAALVYDRTLSLI